MGEKSNPKSACHPRRISTFRNRHQERNYSPSAILIQGRGDNPDTVNSLYLHYFEADPSPFLFSHLETSSRERKARMTPPCAELLIHWSLPWLSIEIPPGQLYDLSEAWVASPGIDLIVFR
jgi:hypothetical protein